MLSMLGDSNLYMSRKICQDNRRTRVHYPRGSGSVLGGFESAPSPDNLVTSSHSPPDIGGLPF